MLAFGCEGSAFSSIKFLDNTNRPALISSRKGLPLTHPAPFPRPLAPQLPAVRSVFPLFFRQLASPRTTMARRPTLDGSQHLSLTESHLSTEATTWPQPQADPSPSACSGDLAGRVSESSQSPSGETLIEERADLDVVERVDGDLEKGGELQKGGEAVEPPPLAADGTPVIIVDWKENDPAFPKNWWVGSQKSRAA